MSVYPGKVITKYFGLVDINLIRVIHEIHLLEEPVTKIIEEVLDEVKEMVKSRVKALGGNCALGFKIDIHNLDQDETKM